MVPHLAGADGAALLDAYRHRRDMPRRRDENFPVASLALPRHVHDPVTAISAFARGADDLADAGPGSPKERLRALEHCRAQRHAALAGGQMRHAAFVALTDSAARHRAPRQVLHCGSHSANPVGRLRQSHVL
jgi:phytoene/squalene synthetase